MEDKMYIFYLKTDRVVTVIGDNLVMDCDKAIVIKDGTIRAAFMFNGIEGFEVKRITENDTRKE